MPIAISSPPEAPLPLNPPRKRWTRAECALLQSSGILDYENLELIEGELIDRMPKNRPHVVLLKRMLIWLEGVFGQDRVNSEAPVDVAPADNALNEPEPDLIVFKRRGAAYDYSKPQAADLHLVVEISDTSLNFDLSVKAKLYARAGIAEYWVLDVNGRRLIVQREPSPHGYSSVVAYVEAESVTPLAAPEYSLLLTDIFRN